MKMKQVDVLPSKNQAPCTQVQLLLLLRKCNYIRKSCEQQGRSQRGFGGFGRTPLSNHEFLKQG